MVLCSGPGCVASDAPALKDHEVPSHRSVLAVFTPSAADPRVLSAFTVGRSHELATLTRALAEAATSRARPHVLLVGSRGSGKSHLLTLAAHHAGTEPLGGPISLAWLPEEIYSITSYRDVLAEILSHVVGARPLPTTSAESLERQLVDVAQSGVIVVIIENLHRIMALIGPHGQRALRAFLHNEQALLLLASTPSLFEGITSHGEPFYGAFRVVQLGELSVDDGRELLLRLARLDGDEELGRFLSSSTGLARLGAVAHLAGGLPRLWLLLAGCVTVDLLDELVPLFVKLLDELTPYYKARMDDLSPAKAKLVSALCFAREGGALTVRELAEHVDSSQQSTSKLLNELERERFVVGRKVPGTDQRVTYYELREPLLRHCLELKSSRGGAPLAVIVEILRGWYDAQMLRAVLAAAPAGSPSEDYARAALMAGAPAEPIDRAYASGSPADLVTELRLRWRSAGPASTTLAIEAMALLATDGKAAADALLEARVANLSSADAQRACALFSKALEAGGEGTGAEQLARSLCAALSVDDSGDRLLSLVTGGWLLSQGEHRTARAVLENAFDDRGTISGDQISLAIGAELAFALWQLGLRSEARALGDQILAARMRFFGPDDPDTLTSRGNLAHWTGEAGDPAAARDLFTDLIVDRSRVLGAEHPDTLASRHSHAHWTGGAGDPAAARDLLADLVADRTRVLGAEHPDTLTSRNNHAYWTGEAGDPSIARDLLADLVPDRGRVMGAEHRYTLASRQNHAYWTGQAGDPSVARHLFADLVADDGRVLGADHPDTLAALHNYARWTGEAGDSAAARDLFDELVQDRSRVMGTEHPDTLAARHSRAYWTGAAGDPAAARDLFADLVPDRSRVIGAAHPDTLASRHNHADWTGDAGDPASARDLFLELTADCLRLLGADHVGTIRSMNGLLIWQARAGDPVGALTEALSLGRTTKGLENIVGQLVGIVADDLRAPMAEQRYSDVLTSLGFSLSPIVRALVVLVAHASIPPFATSSFLDAIQALGLNSWLLGALGVLRTVVDDPDQVLHELDQIVSGEIPELAPLRRVVKAAVAALDGDGAPLAGLAAEERALAEELAGLAVSTI
jgi:DNA-binding MarR family transcriptional regulator